jgi:hypothetical protein
MFVGCFLYPKLEGVPCCGERGTKTKWSQSEVSHMWAYLQLHYYVFILGEWGRCIVRSVSFKVFGSGELLLTNVCLYTAVQKESCNLLHYCKIRLFN